MSSDTPNAPFNIKALLPRLLPVICIGVVINLAFSLYTQDAEQPRNWPRWSIAYLIAAALLSLLPWFWHCVRLAIWGRFFGVKIPVSNLLRIVIATDVGGSITPQAVGGAPVKMTMLIEQGYTPGKAATLTLLGSFEDVVFFAFAIPVSLVLTRPWENPLWQHAGDFLDRNGNILIIALLAAMGVFLIFKKTYRSKSPRKAAAATWQQHITDFKASTRLIRKEGRKPFVLSILAISAQWLTRFSILLAVLLALGWPNDLMQFFLLQWMVFVAMVFIPTPGAAGGAEAAFLLVFGKIIPAPIVGAALAGWRFLTYYFMLLAGVAILWMLHKRAAVNQNAPTHNSASGPF